MPSTESCHQTPTQTPSPLDPAWASMSSTSAAPRRSGNYGPTSWANTFLQSLPHADQNAEDALLAKVELLKEEVGELFKAASGSATEVLELVDAVQQLGVGYHFEEEIKGALDCVSASRSDVLLEGDLHHAALLFRVLRDSGYEISQEVLAGFVTTDEQKKNMPANFHHHHGTTGILSLYEASYYGFQVEDIVDEAKILATSTLKNFLESGSLDDEDRKKVVHALELPIRWRMPRLHTRWFIDVYSKDRRMIPSLLQLAKVDFTLVQSMHRRELKKVSSWWSNLGLARNMPFARDRVVENFLFSMGMLYEPRFRYFRERFTMMLCILAVMDDLYDIYGTIDELELFTQVIERWDINAIEVLPNYMKISFLALFNNVNQVAYEALRDNGADVAYYLKKAWVDLCKTYALEARWYHNKIIPAFEKYLENGRVSIAFPLVLPYICVLTMEGLQNQNALDFFAESPDLVRYNSIICRLVDDMSTSVYENRRGDVAKAVECYMNQENASEEEARNHINDIVSESWKKINKERFMNPQIANHLVDGAINLTRTMHCVYLYGDGYGFPAKENKDQVMSLLVETIP